MSKGSKRRPERRPGSYRENWEKVKWHNAEESIVECTNCNGSNVLVIGGPVLTYGVCNDCGHRWVLSGLEKDWSISHGADCTCKSCRAFMRSLGEREATKEVQ